MELLCAGLHNWIRSRHRSWADAGLCIFKLVAVFADSFNIQQAWRCVDFNDLAKRRRLFHVLNSDGKWSDPEWRIIVYPAHGGEEDCNQGQEDHQHSIWKFFDAEVTDHCDLPHEQCYNNPCVNMGPHTSPTLKGRDIHLQSLQDLEGRLVSCCQFQRLVYVCGHKFWLFWLGHLKVSTTYFGSLVH